MEQNSLSNDDNANSGSKVHNKSLIEEFEHKLTVGQIVTSPENAYLLYCEYGRIKGFSVRKGKQEYFHDNSRELYMKEFECSCKGTKDEKRSNKGKQPIYLKMETRFGCRARLRVGRKKNEEWKVVIFDIEHNHDMVAPDQSYMLRSARNISYVKGDTLKALVDAGFSVANAYSYMQQESHGRENVGFAKKDAYNYINRLAKDHKQVDDGDAAELIRYFKNKSNEDALFYWDFQVDENNRMCNFFFRDGRCRLDYEVFGDVLSIDTTYKTNKYNLICAPFTGINHHKNNVMFGLAFMSNETESSFQWLFSTFLESMGGKQPESVFTDQCQAMMNAVEIVFPNSLHRLCQWHICQNAPSHFGSLNNNSEFKNMFYKCMEFCESEEEFENVWSKMIADYNPYDHSWLNNMYKLRNKWSTAFSKHRFSAGLKATSRSEGTNSTLKVGGKSTHSLFECVVRFEKVQNTWRQDERENDFKCRRGMPTLVVKTNYLLRDAAAVYTHTIYNMFQSELLNSLGIDLVGEPLRIDTLIQFKVRSQGSSGQVCKVEFFLDSHEVNCSCQLFESVGILCKHALLVFKEMNVHKLPTRYIKVRWTKGVRDVVHFNDENLFSSNQESDTVYVNHAMRFCYDLTMRSKFHPEARDLVRSGFEGVLSNLNSLLDKLDLSNTQADIVIDGSQVKSSDAMEEQSVINDELVRNPLYVKSRGVNNLRLPSHWDLKSKRGKTKIESSTLKYYKVLQTSMTCKLLIIDPTTSDRSIAGEIHADGTTGGCSSVDALVSAVTVVPASPHSPSSALPHPLFSLQSFVYGSQKKENQKPKINRTTKKKNCSSGGKRRMITGVIGEKIGNI
ncbi:PREDICTED: protein FAR1-RELATED SEQUENCE 5-like [Erythranthe guttata]|uniref:protein FAR1-RELATED SEQUENCE 5-like n=1 Tax=Erythranthe guttata TaxID=4155 RepID=UPI00064DBE41|nr:PREDICTED: protein FAR1-RELATED SEQUENCE 5-like [Erythranthe guttata]|eukprot:XP_012836749.1 PREDICTED: protein FAR1-RELATED SEQUENCE 5-like [Erythranthe guttata]